MPEVKCSVSNCTYWGEGNNCKADAIMIEIDEHADADFHAEFGGEEFDSEHKDKALNVRNTCCHTFTRKS
ncbi:DUF1540 domain-containing protein [Paenibacillus larvae]|uniref:ABC transporter, permease protein, putative n=4 Tax=Paenibacillus larvae TaxID=1464 RepID=V9W9D6_9BACL|nr:DUF1540 domain-containing protein [Paenibacillus larvae]AHD06295.1 ABC transporter, permease protein, putative [Paenibacillus larvae subsp. larvae DSM 25430]AQR77357.1 hypothetical protein BXP28_08335 [Paenibacillus larvae subsp. larvae]AQT83894.1 hypothetical protein B1222_04945 [Paenibacillus larvae subsp. pulvifaciens]AQZ45337.1 hypothetical protein B5S25_00760 [Paenibacillus larvae subsp. pulvifaciens]ARF67134.1 hypothetical protein B7C51_03905 [Paenibacillus larvae subsp. pulvifaciens]